jgi:hypothetical protein
LGSKIKMMSIMTISSKFLTVLAIMGGTVLAGLTSGFTTAKDPDFIFAYQPLNPNDYSAQSVQDLSNWVAVDVPEDCNGSNKACSIETPSTYVDDSGLEPELESTISLQTASDPITGETRVTGVALGDNYANKD